MSASFVMSSCFFVSGHQYFILNKGHRLLRKQQKSHDLIRVDIFNQVSCVKEVFFSLSLFMDVAAAQHVSKPELTAATVDWS